MYANLYKCQILNKVKLLLIHVQQDMEKKLYKIDGDLIVNFRSACIYTCTVTTPPIANVYYL